MKPTIDKLELFEWQHDLMVSVLNEETGYTIVNVPRGAGKSTIAALLTHYDAHVFAPYTIQRKFIVEGYGACEDNVHRLYESGLRPSDIKNEEDAEEAADNILRKNLRLIDYSDVHTFVFDDVEPPEEWLEFLKDRLVIYLRSPKLQQLGTLKVLTVDQDFTWDGETKTLTYGEQKFSWMPDWKLPDWATGRLFYFSTLGSPEALNKARFDEANKNRCAGSLVGAPLNENHKRYDLSGQNIIIDAEVTDGRLEGICYVEDSLLLGEYDTGNVVGCSIDYKDRNIESVDYDVEGAFCVGLAWVTNPYICGYPDSLVSEAIKPPADMDIEQKQMFFDVNIPPGEFVDKELLKTRTIIFSGRVGDQTCREASGKLEYLGSVNNGPIKVILNSGGGSVYAGLLVFDTIKQLTEKGIEVTCEVRGLAASMGAIIIQAGTYRVATPNTRFLIHEVSSWAWGKTSEMEEEILEIKKVNDLLKSIIAERTGKTMEDIEAIWHKKDVWLSAEEAMEFGLIDEIIEGEMKTQTQDELATPESDIYFSWLNSIELRFDGLIAKEMSATEVFKRLEKEEEEEDLDDDDDEDETKTLTLGGDDGGGEGAVPPSSCPPDDQFAFIEDGGTIDEGGKTTPRELRHLQFRDDDGYDEVLLLAAMDDLKQMTFNGEISKSASEAAKHELIEGFKALELDIPEWASGSDGLENRVNVKHLAFLMRKQKRQAAFRDRFNPLRGGDDEGEGNRMHPRPSEFVSARKKRELRGNRRRMEE